jgi:hypothetical protein
MYPRKVPEGVDPEKFWQAWVQSRVFMISIIKVLHRLYELRPDKNKSVLDVGPHFMGGTTLLKELHSSGSFTRLKLDVSCIELDARFESACKEIDPEMPYLIGDVKDLPQPFDIIIASHVIEHVSDMIAFGKVLKSKARDFVIFACPWRESPLATGGHLHSIGKELPQALRASGLEIYTDMSWGADREAAIFWCHGDANQSDRRQR